MKTAYELAMERLNKSAPAVRLSDEQKRAIADLDSRYRARVAEREIALQSEMRQARERGDGEAFERFEQQLSAERRSLQAELEEKKEAVRNAR